MPYVTGRWICASLPLIYICSLPETMSEPHVLAAIEPRVQELLARMTPEAKVAQLFIGRGPKVGVRSFPDGFGATPGMTYSRPRRASSRMEALAAEQRYNDALQHWAIENTTYGIPLTFYAETLHTAQNGATIFPTPAGLGATWNLPLVQQVGATIGYEARLKGIDRGWSPELQVATDPRFGRIDEAFSEDPHFVSKMGVALATGLHGDAISGADTYGNFSAVLTEAKHFGAYGQSGMDGLHTDISNATLFNVYLRPWRDYAKQAGGRGLMASHQALNGVPNHANHWLLTTVWRQLFEAEHTLIGSDQDDVTRLYVNKRGTGFGVARDCLSAGAMALNAGVDCALGYECFLNLTVALNSKLIDESTLDRAAGNVLRSKFAAGLFDGHAFSDPNASQKIHSPAAQRLAYAAAVESITMVNNNNNTLPLKLGPNSVRHIAVVGPNAGCANGLTTCDYDGFDPIIAQMGPYVWDTGEDVISVLQAAQSSTSNNDSHVSVTYSQGASWVKLNNTLKEAAVAAASAADVVIAVVGDTDAQYGHGTCAEGIDADSLDLPGGQLALLEALADTGVPVVVVLINGRPATFGAGPQAATGANNAVLSRLAATLVAWRPGEAGGRAIWDVITGKQNPSGHLTHNWLRNVGAVRGPCSPWFQPRPPGLPFHYVTEPATPLFPFGYGLSYTTFEFGPMNLSATSVSPQSTFEAHLTISSKGPAGKAVVQVYASSELPMHGGIVRFEYTLLSFAKVYIPADSTGVYVSVPCSAQDLDWYDVNAGKYVVFPGSYMLYAAQHSGLLPTDSRAQVIVH